jgi:hypothetical protein
MVKGLAELARSKGLNEPDSSELDTSEPSSSANA